MIKASLFIALIVLVSANYQHQEIIDSVNSLETTWTAGINERWIDATVEDIQVQLGHKPIAGKAPLPVADIQVAANIPSSFDPREQWPKCDSIKEIRDQCNCGSCWAFGAVEAMSDRICIASGQTKQTRISSEDLLECCESCGQGCEGGDAEASWEYFADSGIVTGDLYADDTYCKPYFIAPCNPHFHSSKYPDCPTQHEATPRCVNQCNSQYSGSYSSDKVRGQSPYSIQGVSQIQTELMTNGPVETCFSVYSDFPTYRTGVYQHTSSQVLGGHCVKMLGWGEENGTPYWLIANSWNDQWGANGYFKILRGQDECGIESQVVAGQVSASNAFLN